MNGQFLKRRRRAIALFMSFLMILSLFMPQVAAANVQTEDIGGTLAENLELEKQLEEEALSSEKETADQDDLVDFTDADGLPRLQDGLGEKETDAELDESDKQDDSAEDTAVMDGKVEQEIYQSLKKDDTVDVIIHMKGSKKKGLSDIKAKSMNRTERLTKVKAFLQDVADQSQAKLLKQLQVMTKKDQVANVQSLWIINGIAATVTEDGLREIEAREDVEKILLDEIYEVPETMEKESKPRLPEWGLEKINAPRVWAQYGIDGKGVVVGIMDSGVDGDHEALAKSYRGGEGEHKYSWVDYSGEDYQTPRDGNGHGTHVAGSAVGGGDGEPIGVAPGAKWIAAKIFNDVGRASESGIHQAFEWFMAPGGDPEMAPDVVNNSWGNADPYNVRFKEDVDAWVAAGIFPLFAAGNDGPGSETIGSPGSFPEAFSIGATDPNDQIAPFSSRGPVTWDGKRYTKPEVSAPGVGIYSAWPGGGYNTISGTSMATPHVAGVIALMLEANPDLSIDEIKHLLTGTARAETHMGAVPNVNYGYGVINGYQAVTEAAFSGNVKGTVINQDAEPIPARIFIEKENVDIEAAEDGSFEFKLREGTHDVFIESFGYESETVEVKVTKGETVEVNWQLNKSAQFDVIGTVKDADGTPVPYAYVRILGTPLKTLRTDEQGQFSFMGVPAGSYKLVVTGKGITGVEKHIEVAADVDLDLTVGASGGVSETDWQTANNNPNRNAVASEDISLEAFKENWTIKTHGQVIFSSPVANEDTVIITTEQGYVEAYDLESGEEKWVFRTEAMNRGTPTIADDLVIVSGGQQGKVYGLDIDSGALRWEVSVGNRPIYETPLYEDGTVYLTSSTTTNKTEITAVDVETGAKAWTTTIDGSSFFGAALGDDQLVVGSNDASKLYALSKGDGSELWQFTVKDGGFASHPVIVDGIVYAFSSDLDRQGDLWAIDAASGKEVWHAEGMGDTQAASPVVYGDVIIASSASNPMLKGLDRHTGELLWKNKDVSTTVNNGAATENGLFFITDQMGMLKAVNVFNGQMEGQWALDSSSSSTPAIVAGQVIVGMQSGISVYSSLGVLAGKMQDKDGNPLDGFVRILGTDEKVDVNKDGTFELSTLPGKRDVLIGKYGYEQVEETIDFRSGYVMEKEYALDQVGEGELVGNIIDARSKEPISDVTIKVQDTPLETISDDEGGFAFNPIYEGSYELIVEDKGYVTTTATVDIMADKSATVSIQMDPIDVAVLNDYESTVTDLLNSNDVPAEERQWDGVLDDLDKYELLYLNGAYRSGGWQPEKDDVDALIEAANQQDVSIIFAGTWGPNYGSIQHLVDYYEDPESVKSDNSDTTVTLQVDQEHPILGDREVGDRVQIIKNGKANWFNGYSGRTLATVESQRLGNAGAGISYKPVSENSAHLLLSTHATASWNSPSDWLQVQHEFLVNSASYLIDDSTYAQYGGSIVDESGDPVEARVEVLDTGVYAQADEAGEFALFHDEGKYEVEVRAPGYDTAVSEIEFVHGEPVSDRIELAISNGGRVSGVVTDAVSGSPVSSVDVALYDKDGDIAAETETAKNGYYELSDLKADTYTLAFMHDDYVLVKDEIKVSSDAVEYDQTLDLVPGIAILGDKGYGDNLSAILGAVNMDATNYNSIDKLTEEIDLYDVVFYNEENVNEKSLHAFETAADRHGVSIIYGDMYFSGGGIGNLTRVREDPASQKTIGIRSSSAQYIVDETSPLFGDRQVGDKIDILIPGGSRVATFEDYSGFELAGIKHAENDEIHGTGIAYKPRTADSMELLMSGHSIGIAHSGDDYTEAGRKLFIDAINWAANERFNAFAGTVTDEAGEAIDATVTMEINGAELTDQTTRDDASFAIAAPDGEADVTISSYGYQSQTFTVAINDNIAPFAIELAEKPTVGSLEGYVTNSLSIDGVEDVHIQIVGYERETTTDSRGYYHIGVLEPGTYDVELTKKGFLQKNLTVDIAEGETSSIDVRLQPSPTVGIIVDSQSKSAVPLADYLEDRGFETKSMFYDDLDMLEDVDVVFANSDYNNDLIPSEATFNRFMEALDETETSVIWTGQQGGRGSIRYLVDYTGDPETEYRGSGPGNLTATILEDHPIFEGVDKSFEFTNRSGYYYGFDGYTGTILADYEKEGIEDTGYMIGFKGRTINSVEVLLSGMTIGFGFHPGSEHFDENREKIINNAILWAINDKSSHAGEVRGQVINEMGNPVHAEVTVEGTGEAVTTDPGGNFFLGLKAGTYTLNINGFGHTGKAFEVTVENGEVLEESFVLQSDQAGNLTGVVRDQATGDLLEGAEVEVLGTPVNTETNSEGAFQMVLPEGAYDIRIAASGYQPYVLDVTVEEGQTESVEINLTVSKEIALLATSVNQDRMIGFLEENGYSVTGFAPEEYKEIEGNIADYALVILNDIRSMNESEFKGFIEAGDEAQVSMVFANQFSGGSIKELRDYTGDPNVVDTGYVPNGVGYEVLQEHPIFRGYEKGDVLSILERDGLNQQYGMFDEYSGTMLADLVDDEDERIGGGLAYNFRSSNHVHLLLGSLASSSYGHPGDRWTDDARTVYINAIDWALDASLGEINGIVTDEDGEPIEQATVSIKSENKSVHTNDKGQYIIGIGTGEYIVSVEAIGYKPAEETVVVGDIGDVVEQNFTLEAAEQMTLSGQVTDQATEAGLEGITVTAAMKETAKDFSTETDGSGDYQIPELAAGEYDVTFEEEGYNTVKETVTIKNGENLELNVAISAFTIAVLDDYKGELSTFLNDNQLAAVATDWSIIDHADLYDVVIVNASDGSNENMEALIEASNKHETSLVFLDTWGAGGTVEMLEEALGHPTLDEQGYGEEAVFLHTDDTDHPIFAGFDADEIRILEEKSPYMTFKDYEGTSLAGIDVGNESKGTSIGYAFQGGQHLQLIMSAFAVNNMVGPDRGWTDDGKQIFLQAIEWARDAKTDTDGPELTIDNLKDGEKINRESITVEGTVTDTNLDYVKVNGQKAKVADGNYAARIMLENGENIIEVEAMDQDGNLTTASVTIEVKYDAPQIENLTPTEDQYIGEGESVKIDFTSEPGLRATFIVHMPLTNSGSKLTNATELPMMETTNGQYVGYWTIPKNAYAEGAVIEVIVKDAFGNVTREQAGGKLFINVEE